MLTPLYYFALLCLIAVTSVISYRDGGWTPVLVYWILICLAYKLGAWLEKRVKHG